MATTVTTLQAVITANVTGLLAGLGASDAAIKESAAGVAGLGASAAEMLPGAMVAAGAVAAIGFAAYKAVDAASSFQTQLTQLVTGAGLTANQLGAVRDGILSMSTATGTSTDQLTAGMYMISSASSAIGQAASTAQDKLNILQAAAEGAKVGAADLGTVADATTTLMADFKDQNLTATQAVNSLIATVANGKTHMEDLASALSSVAPAASASHVSLNDMMGALATMTGEGVDASSAATYLRQTIIALNAPSDTAKKALADIGITTDQLAADMKQGLPYALGQITSKLADMYGQGSPQYIAALKDISGGMREMQGMLDLTGSHLSTFGANVASISDQVKAGGDSVQNWNTIQGTFAQQMDKVGASVNVLFINIGSQLLPALTNLASTVAPLIANFAKFTASVLANKQLMTFLGPVFIGLAIVMGGVMVAALVAMAMAAWAAMAPFMVLAAPIIGIALVIGALVAIIIIVVTHFQQLWTWVTNLAMPIKILAAILLLPLAPIILTVAAIVLLVTHFQQVVDFLGGTFSAAWTGMGSLISGVWSAVTTTIKGQINAIIELINIFIRGIDSIHINLPSIGGIGGGSIGFNIKPLPLLAAGGLITSGGAAIVGENGPEIVNLPTGASVLPNPQSQQMMQNSGQGMTQTIIIQLDGKTIGQAAAKNMPAVIRAGTGTRRF